MHCFSACQKGELGIAGYGVSVTTLEEVFLRVGHGSDEVNNDNAAGSGVYAAAAFPAIWCVWRGRRGVQQAAHISLYFEVLCYGRMPCDGGARHIPAEL